MKNDENKPWLSLWNWLRRLDDALHTREEDLVRAEVKRLRAEVDKLKSESRAH